MFRASCILAAVLGLVIFDLPAAFASGRQERDTWQVQSAEGKPFGSIHTVVELQPDGGRHYVCKSRSRIDLLGTRQEIEEDFDCVVTKEFQLVSFSRTKRGLTGQDEVSGRVAGGRLQFTLKRQGLTLERSFPVASQAIPSICVPDVLAAQNASRDAIQLKVIDSTLWTIRTAKARRVPAQDGRQRWDVRFDDGFGGGVWTISAQRDHDEFDSKTPAYAVLPSSAEPARELAWHSLAPREMLMFPLDRDVAFPERLQSLTVRLAWKDVPAADLQLTDLRQHVAREFDEKGRHVVELRLDHPELPRTAAPYPMTEKSLAPSLSESDFILPNDAAIHKQALAWTDGSKTSLEAVQRLSHQVCGYLQEGSELIAETLSGPEVLACRKGKCTEYTTLFASLARSIGIPTRVSLGMRLVGTQWIGHMWCEAYVGEWIPVDASVDEVGGSPALLKLTHSDTVLGTQRARWAVATSLEVSVVGSERRDKSAAKIATGIVHGTYSNADFACRLSTPGEGWKLEDKSQPGVSLIQFHPPGKFSGKEPLIHFVAFALPVHVEPGLIVTARKLRMAPMCSNFEVLKEEGSKIHGVKGVRFVFRRDESKKSKRKFKTTELVSIDGNSGYLLNLIADEATHDQMLASFERLAGNFESMRAVAKTK